MNKQNPKAGIEWRVTSLDAAVIVSNEGEIKRNGKLLKPRLKNSGYQFVTLRVDGRRKNVYVHSLVALVFIGERPPKHDVNHKDGNKLNNHAANLEYVTRAENMRHARAHGLHRNFADGHYNSKLTSRLVTEIRHAHDTCGLRGKDMAQSIGVSARTIDDVIDGKTWGAV